MVAGDVARGRFTCHILKNKKTKPTGLGAYFIYMITYGKEKVYYYIRILDIV
ncbi:hypothetical protein N752_04235 [Desulforamulus aquiferis]|nr:hypothetical protein N752_04235 [Desulforamulus aquiferis]